MMTDEKLWKQAQELAAKEYEAENCEPWEDTDKYEREDWIFSVYTRLKAEADIKM